MQTPPCADMELLIQAELDNELGAADAARVAHHLRQCPACAQLREDLGALSARLRAEAPPYPAPPPLRARLTRRRRVVAPAVAGLALAASLAIAALFPRDDKMTDDVVAAHIRALQPGHLTDVLSTDRHTVKPWFDGKLPFAPPVRDFAAQGFPLLGGRLDYLPHHTAATLIYGRRKHVIDLFIWPDDSAALLARTSQRQGYNTSVWHRDGMAFWAVSDLNPAELGDFAGLWQGRSPAR